MGSLFIQHWEKITKKEILLPPIGSSIFFQLLHNKIATAFQEELEGHQFRIYSLPDGFVDVGQRTHIKSIDDLNNFALQLISSNVPPSLYVFNFDKESPTKPPELKRQSSPAKVSSSTSNKSRSPKSSSSSSSVVSLGSLSSKASRDNIKANLCRSRDKGFCVFCDYNDNSARQACHILELETYNNKNIFSTDEERSLKLLEYDIDDINSVRNMISLCINCHRQFDNKWLSIHPDELTLIVSDEIRERCSTQGSISYTTLHGKTIAFNGSTHLHPPNSLLKYRHEQFEIKLRNTSNYQRKYYCPFCTYINLNESALTNHIATCSVTVSVNNINLA